MFGAGVDVGVVDSIRVGELGCTLPVAAPNGLGFELANGFGFSVLAKGLGFPALANGLGFSAAAKGLDFAADANGLGFSACVVVSPSIDLKFEPNIELPPAEDACSSELATSSPALGSRWNVDCSLKGWPPKGPPLWVPVLELGGGNAVVDSAFIETSVASGFGVDAKTFVEPLLESAPDPIWLNPPLFAKLANPPPDDALVGLCEAKALVDPDPDPRLANGD